MYRPHSEGMGKVLFSQVSVSPHFGWGIPHPADGGHPLPSWCGVPISFPMGVTPSFPTGVTPSFLIGVVPHPRSEWGVPQFQARMGVLGIPLHPAQVPSQDRGCPPPPGPRSGWGVPWESGPGLVQGQDGGKYPNWNSTACTCYAAGCVPLAFTQEDFLVTPNFVIHRDKLH